MVTRESIELQRLTDFLSSQIRLKEFYKECTVQADCILCLLHTDTQISHIQRSPSIIPIVVMTIAYQGMNCQQHSLLL